MLDELLKDIVTIIYYSDETHYLYKDGSIIIEKKYTYEYYSDSYKITKIYYDDRGEIERKIITAYPIYKQEDVIRWGNKILRQKKDE